MSDAIVCQCKWLAEMFQFAQVGSLWAKLSSSPTWLNNLAKSVSDGIEVSIQGQSQGHYPMTLIQLLWRRKRGTDLGIMLDAGSAAKGMVWSLGFFSPVYQLDSPDGILTKEISAFKLPRRKHRRWGNSISTQERRQLKPWWSCGQPRAFLLRHRQLL